MLRPPDAPLKSAAVAAYKAGKDLRAHQAANWPEASASSPGWRPWLRALANCPKPRLQALVGGLYFFSCER